MKLMEIKRKQPDGIYVGLNVDKETKLRIKQLCKTLKIDNRVSGDKLHTTLIYSRKYVPDIKLNEELYPMTVKGKELEVFDTRDGKRALVLILDAPKLTERHNEIMSEYQTTYDFDEYRPHITLCYDCGDFEPKSYGGLLPEVTYTGEYLEDLVLDWQNKEKEEKVHEQYIKHN